MRRTSASFFGVALLTAALSASCQEAVSGSGAGGQQAKPAQATTPPGSRPLPAARIRSATITILSSNVTNFGSGEWGFAALVEADGRRILFDTGAQADTVLRNVRSARIDLSEVTDLVFSHGHEDHTGGLMALRSELGKAKPQALSRAHLAPGFFYPRIVQGREVNWNGKLKAEYEAGGGTFIEHAKAEQIAPGVWLTGPIARVHPEENWWSGGGGRVKRPDSTLAENNMPEDQALVLDTERGLVVLSGCGHAGIINTLEYARQQVRQAPLHAVIGGFHLIGTEDARIDWTARKLKELGVENFFGAHCTGIEAVYRIRQITGLDRKACAVAAVGGVFRLDKGIDPGPIAR